MLVNVAEIFTVLSNLALLIPAITAARHRRVFRSFVFFLETFVSSAYHIGDYTGHCLFSFKTLHHLDFWFAQMIMILNLLYLFDFNRYWYWLEWILIFIGGFVLVILQITLPGELYVQAIVSGVIFLAIIIYWIVYACTVGKGHLPPYDWSALALAIALLAGSTILYSAQLIWPSGYWLAHSFWHIAAALGSHYMFFIKKPAPKWANAAGRIL